MLNLSPKSKKDCGEEASERQRVIPSKGFPQIKISKNNKDQQGDDLLNDFELVACELSVAEAVSRHLKTIFRQSNQPARAFSQMMYSAKEKHPRRG